MSFEEYLGTPALIRVEYARVVTELAKKKQEMLDDLKKASGELDGS